MKPWVKLYRAEPRAFAMLPLYVRALAAELLKLTDDDGVIHIGRREPWEAIAWALGATRGDRRMLKLHVSLLLEDGYIVREGDSLRMPSFPRFQRGDAAPSAAPRSDHDGATTEQRPSNEATTTEQRSDHESGSKPPESQRGTVRALNKTEDRDRDEEIDPPATQGGERALRAAPLEAHGEERPTPSPEAVAVGVGILPTPGPGDIADPSEVRRVVELFEAAWRAVAGRRLGLIPARETQRAWDALRWARTERPEDPWGLLAEAARAACADAGVQRSRKPWWDFADTPGRWLVAAVPSGPARARRVAAAALCVGIYRRLWERAMGTPWEGPRPGKGASPETIDTWAAGEAHRCGATPEQVITCSIRRWSETDDWPAEHGYPWRAWAIEYSEHWRPEDLLTLLDVPTEEPAAAAGGAV